MDKESIFEIIKKNLFEILPELEGQAINPEDSLKELGANSIDRMEILTETMAELELKIPLMEFAGIKNISGLIDKFAENLDR